MNADDALVEAVEDLVHDVAKYMVFEVRFGGAALAGDAFAEAVRSDVCETRRSMNREGERVTETAWQLWERMLPSALQEHPIARTVDARMKELPAVEWGNPSTDWQAVAALAQMTSDGIRELLVSLRGS